jgi:hypothetical protein
MHESVNDRLRQALQFMQIQNEQFRTLMAVLVHRLGAEQSVTQSDIKALADLNGAILMTAKPAVLAGPDGQPQQEEILLKVVTGDEAKALQEQKPRIVAPEESSLVIAR